MKLTTIIKHTIPCDPLRVITLARNDWTFTLSTFWARQPGCQCRIVAIYSACTVVLCGLYIVIRSAFIAANTCFPRSVIAKARIAFRRITISTFRADQIGLQRRIAHPRPCPIIIIITESMTLFVCTIRATISGISREQP